MLFSPHTDDNKELTKFIKEHIKGFDKDLSNEMIKGRYFFYINIMSTVLERKFVCTNYKSLGNILCESLSYQ